MVDMMRSAYDDHMYYEDDNYQFMSMRYEVYPYHMVFALPKKSVSCFDHGLDSEFDIMDVIKNMKKCTFTQLMIPRIKIEQEEDLKELCLSMGLDKMFEPSNDFDPMFESMDKKYISKIKQKTFCEVNESGTEASAVTTVVMVRESMAMPRELRKVQFIANHPFSLFIIGPRDIVLFAGRFFGY